MPDFATDPSAEITPLTLLEMQAGFACDELVLGRLNWILRDLYSRSFPPASGGGGSPSPDKGMYVYANRTALHTNDAIKVTTDGGLTAALPSPWQLYVCNVTGPNTTSEPTFELNGLPPKLLRKADGGILPVPYYERGTHLSLRYDVSADEYRIMFMSPIQPTQRVSVGTFLQTNVATNQFEGSISPDIVLDPTRVMFLHKVTTLQQEGGVTYKIPQIVDEARQLRTVTNQQVAPGTWAEGDTLVVRYLASGNFELAGIIRGAVSSLSDDPYAERMAFYTMRNTQTEAAI